MKGIATEIKKGGIPVGKTPKGRTVWLAATEAAEARVAAAKLAGPPPAKRGFGFGKFALLTGRAG